MILFISTVLASLAGSLFGYAACRAFINATTGEPPVDRLFIPPSDVLGGIIAMAAPFVVMAALTSLNQVIPVWVEVAAPAGGSVLAAAMVPLVLSVFKGAAMLYSRSTHLVDRLTLPSGQQGRR